MKRFCIALIILMTAAFIYFSPALILIGWGIAGVFGIVWIWGLGGAIWVLLLTGLWRKAFPKSPDPPHTFAT